MRLGFAIAVGMVIHMLLLVPLGSAQEVPPEMGRTPEQLNTLSGQAMAAAQSGDFQKAIDIWEDILPEIVGEGRVGLHFNLALGYKRLDQLPFAWHHMTAYLEQVGKEDVKAAKGLEKMEKSLVKTHRKVVITCTPEGAAIYQGLAATGIAYACPLTWWFKPGKQFIYVAKQGFEGTTAEHDVRNRGEKGVWQVKLDALPSYGHLVVKGEGRAIQVFLDGNLEGTVPFKRKLKAGNYQLMVGKPGEMPWKKGVIVKANQTTVEEPPNAKPKSKDIAKDTTPTNGNELTVIDGVDDSRSSNAPIQWALIGGGLGVVAVGAILNGVGLSREADLYDEFYPDENTPRADAQAAYDAAYEEEAKAFKNSSVVLYSLGGAAAAAGVIWLIADEVGSPSQKEKGVGVVPMVAPGTAGAIFSMEF
jgi:hypothetical protein